MKKKKKARRHFKERSFRRTSFGSGLFLEKHSLRNFLRFSTFNKKMNPIFAYNSYFFHPNKWPIGKAPKVSSSSYKVGFGFLFMFHAYAYPALDNFTLFTYNWFTFNFQLTSPLFLVFYFLTFRYRSLFYPIFFFAVVFFLSTHRCIKLFVTQSALVVSTFFFSHLKRVLSFLQLSALPNPL